MVYCIMVTGPAYGNQRACSALQFSIALLSSGHQLKTVFFYQDGVYNANRLITPAADEADIVSAWRNLSLRYSVSLHVCNSAALRRGVYDATQASFLKHRDGNLQLGFELSGLGSLAKSALNCDRFIQF